MSNYRAGFVAIIGEPNSGKSTLVNALVESKVAIVSPKPQTTRQRITGILTEPDAQFVFVDSPGVLKSETGVNAFLKEEYRDVMKNADVILGLLPGDATFEKWRELIELIQAQHKPTVFVISKADLMKHSPADVFSFLDKGFKIPNHQISVRKAQKEARDQVLAWLKPLLPKADVPLYEDELYTTQTVREMSAEIIRERCFENLEQEIPYGLAVKIEKFEEPENPKNVPKIYADIVVEKDSHKGIVIGKAGSMLKKIGSESRAQIEKLLGAKIYLELHVSVRENWTLNKTLMKELGYVIKE